MTEGIRIDVMKTPIKVTTIHPGFIQSEINEKVKTVPFIVDTETGCKAMVKAIEKEVDSSFVPTWPWALFRYIARIAPLSVLAKMSQLGVPPSAGENSICGNFHEMAIFNYAKTHHEFAVE